MPKRKTKQPALLIDKTYFVSKLHDAAKGMLSLLTDRLESSGWRVTCSTLSKVQIYSKGNRSRVLVTTSHDTLGGMMSHAYYEGDQELTVGEYLAMQTQVSKLRMMLSQMLTVQETVYRFVGTAEMLAIYSSESGIFVRGVGSPSTHAMLSEYYTLAEDPETLYSALADGFLYELTRDEAGDFDYGDDSDAE